MSIPEIGKPGTNDQNASNGFEWPFGFGGGETMSDFTNRNADYGYRLKFDSTAKNGLSHGLSVRGHNRGDFQ